LRESLGIFDETLPGHWRRAFTECLLGQALTLQDRFDEAEPMLQGAVERVRAARGDGDMFTRETLEYAVSFYARAHREDEGVAYANLLARQASPGVPAAHSR
jgi:hypothetical protein